MKCFMSHGMSMQMLLLVILSMLYIIDSCYLHGTDSGECTLQTLDPVWRDTFMPYCSKAILYPACIPKYQTLPPSREFPLGRWFNNTVRAKDDWVSASVESHIRTRMGYEKNKTMKNLNKNEFGDTGKF